MKKIIRVAFIYMDEEWTTGRPYGRARVDGVDISLGFPRRVEYDNEGSITVLEDEFAIYVVVK